MLVVSNLSLTRGKKRVLDDVSLNFSKGQLTVLMGENGAGKSSLLKTLSGELKPTSGSVLLDNLSLAQWQAGAMPTVLAQRCAVLAQQTPLAFMFSAREVVLMGRSPHCKGYPGAHDRMIAEAALAKLDVSHLANRLYLTLSGGEQARVQLARVLAQVWEPTPAGQRVLLLDEPVAALDIAHQHLALSVAQSFAHEQDALVVAVLHDLNLAAQYADHIVLMKDGRIAAEGSVDETLIESVLSPCFSTTIRRLPHPESGRPLLYAANR